MEIFDANVLIQLVIEVKEHCNVSRANIGLLVHEAEVTECLFQIFNTKCKLETCKVKLQNCVHEDVQERIFTD